jgi:hypothetical protein
MFIASSVLIPNSYDKHRRAAFQGGGGKAGMKVRQQFYGGGPYDIPENVATLPIQKD